MKLRVYISGRGYPATCGVPEELILAEGSTLDQALQLLMEQMPPGAVLSESCLVAISGTHVGTLGSHTPHTLENGDELVLITPLAGG